MTVAAVSRQEHAEAVTPPGGQPTCPLCGVPVVASHRCGAPSPAKPMPGDFRDEVERARALAALGLDPEAEDFPVAEQLDLFNPDTHPDKEHPDDQ